jgi:hypothetical protein
VQIELRADRVSSVGVIFTQLKLGFCAIRSSRAADEEARGRVQFNPADNFSRGSVRNQFVNAISHLLNAPERPLQALHQLTPHWLIELRGFTVAVNS